MLELLTLNPKSLQGHLATEVHRLLRHTFPDDGPNEGDYYQAVGLPETALVLRDDFRVFGHLGIYARDVEIGGDPQKVGILGGIAVAPDRRRVGHARMLIGRAHEHLRRLGLEFSILFAFEPRIYESSGYQLMQNSTLFVDTDGTSRMLVYRGSMYAELAHRHWPSLLLDLRGRTV